MTWRIDNVRPVRRRFRRNIRWNRIFHRSWRCGPRFPPTVTPGPCPASNLAPRAARSCDRYSGVDRQDPRALGVHLDARVDLWKLIDRSEKLAPQRQQIVLREVATEPVEMVCTYRRTNDNPVLQLFLHDVLPTFAQH